MAVLTKIPLNSEHPYWFDKDENKHCWWPSWEHPFGMVKVDKDGVFSASARSWRSQGSVLPNYFHPYTQEASEELPAPSEDIDFSSLNRVRHIEMRIEDCKRVKELALDEYQKIVQKEDFLIQELRELLEELRGNNES